MSTLNEHFDEEKCGRRDTSYCVCDDDGDRDCEGCGDFTPNEELIEYRNGLGWEEINDSWECVECGNKMSSGHAGNCSWRGVELLNA